MARPRLDRERAAQVLALAHQSSDQEAAKHFGITVRSVQRYRELAQTDGDLAAAFAEKNAKLEAAAGDWAEAAVDFMLTGIQKLKELVGKAEVANLRDVTGAVKIVGELDITRKVLGGGARTDRQGPQPPTAKGPAGGSEGAPGTRGTGAPAASDGESPVH